MIQLAAAICALVLRCYRKTARLGFTWRVRWQRLMALSLTHALAFIIAHGFRVRVRAVIPGWPAKCNKKSVKVMKTAGTSRKNFDSRSEET